MKVLGIIPARYASSRFLGKPLAMIGGKTMIERVFRGCSENTNLFELEVATDDSRIFDAVALFGGQAVMTDENHINGTSRIVQVITDHYLGQEVDWVINIQGDEPIIDPESINILINKYNEERAEIITLKEEIKDINDKENPNVVKVVTDLFDNALYFSRSSIPYMRNENKDFKYYRHVGIYGYTVEFLLKLENLKAGILEHIESLEQLKFMENGHKIKVYETKSVIKGVDTKEDLVEVEKIILEKNITLD